MPMISSRRLWLTVCLSALILAGCGGAAPTTAAPTPTVALTPTTAVQPSPGATESNSKLVDFVNQLVTAWQPDSRDLNFVQSVMANPFTIGGPDAPLFDAMPPADANAKQHQGGCFASASH